MPAKTILVGGFFFCEKFSELDAEDNLSTQTPSQRRTQEDIHSDSLELARSSDAIIP